MCVFYNLHILCVRPSLLASVHIFSDILDYRIFTFHNIGLKDIKQFCFTGVFTPFPCFRHPEPFLDFYINSRDLRLIKININDLWTNLSSTPICIFAFVASNA